MSNTSAPDDTPLVPDVDAVDHLRSVVVAYEGSADRQTLYPADASEIERLTHWLSADADAFVALNELR